MHKSKFRILPSNSKMELILPPPSDPQLVNHRIRRLYMFYSYLVTQISLWLVTLEI